MVACVDCASADTLIAPLAAETPVRVWAGIAVLSIQQPGGSYRLATQQGKEAPRPLPGVAAASHPFDANIGPGPNGAPVIVFVRCAAGRRCGLVRTTVAGDVQTPVGVSMTIGGDEHAPSIWGNRLAFAQSSRSGSDWIYVVPLEAGTHGQAMRVRSAPRPKCEGGCSSPRPRVIELGLRGSTLAENINLGLVEAQAVCEFREVRLVDLARRRSRRLKETDCGPLWPTIGASLTATHLIYAVECPAEGGGCATNHTYLYRYGLWSHRLEVAPRPYFVKGIAAEDDSHVVEVRAPETSGGNASCLPAETEMEAPCQLVRAGPIRFKPLACRSWEHCFVWRDANTGRAMAHTEVRR
jgi:hypothetical protein